MVKPLKQKKAVTYLMKYGTRPRSSFPFSNLARVDAPSRGIVAEYNTWLPVMVCGQCIGALLRGCTLWVIKTTQQEKALRPHTLTHCWDVQVNLC